MASNAASSCFVAEICRLTENWLIPALRQVDDHLVIPQIVQEQPRPLLQQVGIDTLRTQQGHLMFPAGALCGDLLGEDLGFSQLFAEPLVGKEATIALHRVKGEVDDNRRRQRLGSHLTEPASYLVEQLHEPRESRRDSGVKGKSAERASPGSSVAEKTHLLRVGVGPARRAPDWRTRAWSLCEPPWCAPLYYCTSGQLPSSSGRKARSAGIVASVS